MKIDDLKFSEKHPIIMGIVNVTPDSFSDGGLYLHSEDAIDHAIELVGGGAAIVDVGGESTRPGSSGVDLEEELNRVIPVVMGIRARSQVAISIDTTKSEVARAAIAAGADMVNDVSAGLFDPELLDVVAKSGAHLCLMHMRGTPEDMQVDTTYDDIVAEICDFLQSATERAMTRGVSRDHIMIDPGIGFGKSAEDNILILKELKEFVRIGFPVLVGTSRKSFMGKLLGYKVDQRLEGTLATLAVAMDGGASVVRVHDVQESKRFMDAYTLFR